MYPGAGGLLVDTYKGRRHGGPDAIKVVDEVLKPRGKRPKGIRIDSGDIAYLSKKARKMLDEAGYPDCTICASNSLDEYIVRDLILQGARVDSFGIGVLLNRYKQMTAGHTGFYGDCPQVMRALKVAGILGLMHQYESKEEAIYSREV